MDLFLLTKLMILLCVIIGTQGKRFVRLCYFTSWTGGRESKYARFGVADIDPTLCTHLVYAFAAIDVDSRRIVPLDPAAENPTPGVKGRHREFTDLKRTYPHLRCLLSIGGEYAGSEQFLAITRNDKVLQRFADTTVEFLRKRGFDGLDVDWEYPNATTKADFSRLLKTLRTAFEADGSRAERLLLTAALPAGRQHIDTGYDMGALTRYLDLANLMTYDYHGSWNNHTGFDSPLHSRISDPSFDATLSTEWTLDRYLSMGLQADKVLVGVTAAGTRFRLQHTNDSRVGAPIVRLGAPRLSDIWQLPDRLAYPEICRLMDSHDAKRVFDEEQQVPYVVLRDEWIGYEDVDSLQNKVAWMVKKGVAGAMFWALDMDDHTGKLCDQGRFPLLRALSSRVGQLENTHLTDNVNPDIRYLTKVRGQAPGAAAPSAALLVLSLVFALIHL